MAKPSKKTSRRHRNESFEDATGVTRQPIRRKSAKLRAEESWSRMKAKPLVCKNQAQKDYLAAIRTYQITFGVGPAGCGKSYVALKHAAIELDQGNVDSIVIVRPAVEAGGGLGFLPGDVSEKTAPYQAPMLDILAQHFGKSHLNNLMSGLQPKIEFAPLEFVRGRTLSNCFILFDEAQNATVKQMQTLLTRIGQDTTLVIDGDPEQIDLKVPSGLVDAVARFKNHEKFGYVEFDVDDIVRSDIVRDIILAYREK